MSRSVSTVLFHGQNVLAHGLVTGRQTFGMCECFLIYFIKLHRKQLTASLRSGIKVSYTVLSVIKLTHTKMTALW